MSTVLFQINGIPALGGAKVYKNICGNIRGHVPQCATNYSSE